MASKIKVDQIQTADGTGTIALQNQLSGMTSASMPTGAVLAVYHDTHSTTGTLQSTSYVNIGLELTITPKSASSKFLITWSLQGQFEGGNSGWGTRINRTINSSESVVWSTPVPYDLYSADTSSGLRMRAQYTHFDAPNTTSTINYKIQARSNASNAAGAISLNNGANETNLVIWEIQG